MTVFPASLVPRHDSMLAVSSVDHRIKLFGKTIPCPAPSDNADQPAEIQDEFHGDCEEDGFSPRGVYDELGVSCGSGNRSEDENCPDFSMNEKERSEVPDCAEKLQESSKNLSLTMEAKVKALRRLNNPVACPRCESLDTKFCYFNNYNVNQPRHFCKHCQRYWTAGGTLRNVPVGAGKRKGKHPSSQRRPTFPLQSVVYRREDSGAAESLLSYSIPQQRTNMKSSSQSASQITSAAGKDSEFSSCSVSSHTPLFVSMSSNGSTTGTEWVEVRKDPSTDFQSHARDGSVGHSSNTSRKAGATECAELSLCSFSVPAPSIQQVPSSNSERSTSHQDQSSTPPETSSNTQILPVLAVPWPFMYQAYRTQIPSRTHTSTFPLYSSAGDTLSCHWSHVPGPVWTFPSTVAPASAHGLGIPTSLGKRLAKDSMEGSSLNGPKTPRIHERESAASSSSLTTLDMVERKSAS